MYIIDIAVTRQLCCNTHTYSFHIHCSSLLSFVVTNSILFVGYLLTMLDFKLCTWYVNVGGAICDSSILMRGLMYMG